MLLQDEAAQLTQQLRALMGAYTQVKAEVDAHRGGWQVSACAIVQTHASRIVWIASNCDPPTWSEAALVNHDTVLQLTGQSDCPCLRKPLVCAICSQYG